jgi:hypothetical protein
MNSQELDSLISDKQAFDSYLYTPLEEALSELDRRSQNMELAKYVASQLPHGIPEPLQGKKNLILFRHIATPNYEISRFMGVADIFPDFNTVILEYLDDRFLDRNENKYFLGKLRFQKGLSKDGQPIYENSVLINFNESNNKPISSLLTKWGERLVDFHHDMFKKRFPIFSNSYYDLSSWLHMYGGSAKDYYKPFLTLLLKDGILFENMLVNQKEEAIVRDVILPAFHEIEQESGFKPLIVPLAPTDMEADDFWHSHPYASKEFLEGKL